MYYFYQFFGVELIIKNERVSRMWENAYLSIKYPKVSRALKQTPDPGYKWLAQLHFATWATFGLTSCPPPWSNPGSATSFACNFLNENKSLRYFHYNMQLTQISIHIFLHNFLRFLGKEKKKKT